MYSQARQDDFVIHMMNGKVGEYLEIGASHPIDISNTYALEQLGIMGYDPVFGARPVKRIIQQKIENNLANLILGKKIIPNSKVTIDFSDDEFKFTGHYKETVNS
jgi:ATP-dependent Clp protease ATP-binding subunit ClpA